MAEAKWTGVLSTTEPRNDVGIIKVRQGNINSEIAEFQIVQNNKPYNLTGLTVYFCASFGLNLVEKPAVVINTTDGRIQYTFDDDSMQSVGRQKGYFSIKKAESKIDSTQEFEFQVESSLMTRSIDGKSYIYKLSTLIKVLDDFIKNGQNNFNTWFDSVKEILYGVDPGGNILRELIEARKNSSGNIFASLKARLDKNEDDTAAQLAQTENEINWVSVKNFGAYGNQIADDYDAFKKAIEYAKENNIYKVLCPSGIYIISKDLVLPPGMELVASGFAAGIVRIYYTGPGWCIRTGSLFGEHRRNTLKGIEIYLKSTTAKGGVLIGDENDDSVIPVQHFLERVTIQDISPNQIGIWLKNASGINLSHVFTNRGTGGTGMLVSANGNNTGVITATNSSFGGYDQNDIGLHLQHGIGGLDGLSFDGCYFGGKTPVKMSGTSAVKNINFSAPHIEPTSQNGEYYGFDIQSVVGLSINSATLYSAQNPNFVGFIFRGDCVALDITGIDANEFKGGTVFKNLTSSPRASLLSYPAMTGVERDATILSGDFSSCSIIENNAFKHKNIKTEVLRYDNTGNTHRYASSNPSTSGGSSNRGDFVFNTTPAELGNSGSRYIVLGWSCIGSGSPGTWIECRALTGN